MGTVTIVGCDGCGEKMTSGEGWARGLRMPKSIMVDSGSASDATDKVDLCPSCCSTLSAVFVAYRQSKGIEGDAPAERPKRPKVLKPEPAARPRAPFRKAHGLATDRKVIDALKAGPLSVRKIMKQCGIGYGCAWHALQRLIEQRDAFEDKTSTPRVYALTSRRACIERVPFVNPKSNGQDAVATAPKMAEETAARVRDLLRTGPSNIKDLADAMAPTPAPVVAVAVASLERQGLVVRTGADVRLAEAS